MTNIGAWTREVGYGIGFLGSAIVGALLILNVAGRIGLDTLPLTIRAILGGVALAVAVYFLMCVAQTARSQSPIRSMGSGGPIWISPQAVRSLVGDLLEASFEIDDARVAVRPAGDGLRVSVKFSLPPEQRIPELGERIQTEIRNRVEDRIGVTVDQVDVMAQAFKATSAKRGPAASKTAKPPTDLPEERDRVD